jgi:hypothetical protein
VDLYPLADGISDCLVPMRGPMLAAAQTEPLAETLTDVRHIGFA